MRWNASKIVVELIDIVIRLVDGCKVQGCLMAGSRSVRCDHVVHITFSPEDSSLYES